MSDSPFPTAPAENRHYELVCSGCGRRHPDDGRILACPAEHPPALLWTDYPDRRFAPRATEDGLFRYRDWLPVRRTFGGAGRSVVYRSTGLASALGLGDLWIAFNGYWPERDAALATCTFKEYEAYTVLGRLPEDQTVLTVASSGNTGAAFAWACSRTRTPCLIVIPGRGLARMRFRETLDPCVTLVVLRDGDYPDAIALADAVARSAPFQIEGGIRNVGRRDGLATVMLSAYETMGRLPDQYFQAVGSGTGAIAALEAAKRVRRETGGELPRLRLCQNAPFTPIFDAWRAEPGARAGDGAERYRELVRAAHADELTNWAPPMDVRGGVRDCLTESGGDVLVSDNEAVLAARRLFRESEGIDIEPAAGVAVAGLAAAAAGGRAGRDASILLNITGGGRARLARDHSLVPAEPDLVIDGNDIGSSVLAKIDAMGRASIAL